MGNGKWEAWDGGEFFTEGNKGNEGRRRGREKRETFGRGSGAVIDRPQPEMDGDGTDPTDQTDGVIGVG